MRVVSPNGEKRGSLRWMQESVHQRWAELEDAILLRLPGATLLNWRSPLLDDGYAEYRDEAFLELLEIGEHAPALRSFWPRRGPQWDGLAMSDAGHRLLVEAKAHIGEFCSPPSGSKSADSQRLIASSLQATAEALGVPEGCRAAWGRHFYQYTNRLAHLWFLRSLGVDAKLVLIGFVDDVAMPGETTPAAWEAAYAVADHVLGLRARHVLSKHVIHVYPSVIRGK